MKKIVGRIASEVLWYLGHWIHFPMHWFEWAWIYPVYNWLMTASHKVQQWSGNKLPWTPYDIEDIE